MIMAHSGRLFVMLGASVFLTAALAGLLARPGTSLKPRRDRTFELDEPPLARASGFSPPSRAP
jgi:hypothetical protein